MLSGIRGGVLHKWPVPTSMSSTLALRCHIFLCRQFSNENRPNHNPKRDWVWVATACGVMGAVALIDRKLSKENQLSGSVKHEGTKKCNYDARQSFDIGWYPSDSGR